MRGLGPEERARIEKEAILHLKMAGLCTALSQAEYCAQRIDELSGGQPGSLTTSDQRQWMVGVGLAGLASQSRRLAKQITALSDSMPKWESTEEDEGAYDDEQQPKPRDDI